MLSEVLPYQYEPVAAENTSSGESLATTRVIPIGIEQSQSRRTFVDSIPVHNIPDAKSKWKIGK